MRKEQKDVMWELFKKLGADGMSATHYELEAITMQFGSDYTSEAWKEFINEPDVRQYVSAEMDIIRQSTMNKMIQNSVESRSTGQAQLLSSLQKLNDASGTVNGPIFIYSHVPLNDAQKDAENSIDYSGKVVYSDEDGITILND